MLPNHYRVPCIVLTVLLLTAMLYSSLGQAVPMSAWNWMDIVSEGGTAVLATLWALLILYSRPGGRVTTLLAGGLMTIMLGAWADCMDEFFSVPSSQYWDNWLEACMPVGMLIVTIGLYYWRQEQAILNTHMQKRERLFRDHRSFDHITQLADADYLYRQIRLQQKQQNGEEGILILLDINNFQQINRQFGQAESDRLLQAVSHLLLLNLRPQDLLCRYAGDRFAILLPSMNEAHAHWMEVQLSQAISTLAHHTRDGLQRIHLSSRTTCARANQNPEQLLADMNTTLEAAMPVMFTTVSVS
ncbi:diguanylate cyclase (GGDEF) domain-containing protein [Methylobacillus rhizosphaerae]|uniref:diguanylate cyclase n=1 Tax=Methylobacillus rhizosphaerae TaxID=551994 RepID=A0A238YFD9_9PROT|nr:GGDEF domain-containing protein [Methylobacillus rhizosphaerae]SNR69313.1 diguanylate cyclase (GGDEF) domain-containing protein [Methylobacillus rhizosphaerae]